MEALLHFAGNFWWLIFPLGGVIGGGVRAVAAANERRAQRRLERYRIKQQTKVALAEASGRARNNEAAYKREMTKVLERHDRTDTRWMDYEIDIAKLLDFPLMTDMRDPLTIGFPQGQAAARTCCGPRTVDDIVGDRDAQLEYRDAVHEYVTAFDVAEAEAIRRRRSDFSEEANSGWNAPSTCCGWRPTTGRPRRSARARTRGRARNSTASSCCRRRRGPASSARSPARSRRSSRSGDRQCGEHRRTREYRPGAAAAGCDGSTGPRRPRQPSRGRPSRTPMPLGRSRQASTSASQRG